MYNKSKSYYRLDGSHTYGSPGRQLTELVEPLKHGTIISYIEPLHLFIVLTNVVRPAKYLGEVREEKKRDIF